MDDDRVVRWSTAWDVEKLTAVYWLTVTSDMYYLCTYNCECLTSGET